MAGQPKASFYVVVALVVAGLVVYALSIGPACSALVRFPNLRPIYETYYEPVVSASSGTAIEAPLNSYMVWWKDFARVERALPVYGSDFHAQPKRHLHRLAP